MIAIIGDFCTGGFRGELHGRNKRVRRKKKDAEKNIE